MVLVVHSMRVDSNAFFVVCLMRKLSRFNQARKGERTKPWLNGARTRYSERHVHATEARNTLRWGECTVKHMERRSRLREQQITRLVRSCMQPTSRRYPPPERSQTLRRIRKALSRLRSVPILPQATQQTRHRAGSSSGCERPPHVQIAAKEALYAHEGANSKKRSKRA